MLLFSVAEMNDDGKDQFYVRPNHFMKFVFYLSYHLSYMYYTCLINNPTHYVRKYCTAQKLLTCLVFGVLLQTVVQY